MNQISKLTTGIDGEFEVGGIEYLYVDIDNIRHVYEKTTLAKMVHLNLTRVGRRIENIMPFFKKPSRIERINKYITDGIEDKSWLGDRDFLL